MATGNASAEFSFSTSVNYGDIDLLEGASAYTVDFWLWLDSASSEQKLISEWDGGNQWMLFLPSTTNLQFIAEGSAGRNRYGIAAGTLSTSQWFHVSVVWSGGQNWKCYIDGSDIANSNAGSSGTVTTIQAGGSKYSIGVSNGSTSTALDGRLAHIHLYDRALSFEETEQLRWKPFTIPTNLVSYIPCYGASTAVCRDLVLGSDGTITGSNLTENSDGPPVFISDGQ